MLLSLMLACSSLFGGKTQWVDATPACEADIYGWSDDLAMYLSQGEGDGAFDFDPDDTPRTGLGGVYDPTTGDYAYRIGFDNDYFLTSGRVEGYGTVYHNGDLDLLQSTVVKDALDVQTTRWSRIRREGCEVEEVSWVEGAESEALVEEGTFEDDATYAWEIALEGYDWRGRRFDDLTGDESIEADDGSYRYDTETYPDGTSRSDFDLDCYDTYRCAGDGTTRFDGGYSQSFEVKDGADVVANVSLDFAYDGSGTQVIDYGDGNVVNCTYTVDAGACSYRCDDGDSGAC